MGRWRRLTDWMNNRLADRLNEGSKEWMNPWMNETMKEQVNEQMTYCKVSLQENAWMTQWVLTMR